MKERESSIVMFWMVPISEKFVMAIWTTSCKSLKLSFFCGTVSMATELVRFVMFVEIGASNRMWIAGSVSDSKISTILKNLNRVDLMSKQMFWIIVLCK